MARRRKRFGGRRKTRGTRGRGRRRGFTKRRSAKGYRSGKQIRMTKHIIEASHPKLYMNTLILGDSTDTPVLSMVTSQPYCINVTDCVWNAALQAMTPWTSAGNGISSNIDQTRVYVDKITIELNVTNLVPTATYFNGNDIKFTTWRFYNPFYNPNYSVTDHQGNKRCQWMALDPLSNTNDFPTSALWWGIQANNATHQSVGDWLYYKDAPINPTTMLFAKKRVHTIRPHPMQGVSGGVAQNTSSSGTAKRYRIIIRPRRVFEYQTSASLDLVPGNDPITRLANPNHNSLYVAINADDETLQPGVQQNSLTMRSEIKIQFRLLR
nr:hypothetical protein [Cressdnaviricota sp.]